MKKWVRLFYIYGIVAIILVGCNNSSNSNQENNETKTNTSGSDISEKEVSTALQLLKDVSFEEVEIAIKDDHSQTIKMNFDTVEALEQIKQLLDQINIKRITYTNNSNPTMVGGISSVAADEEKNHDIAFGGSTYSIIINNEIKLYTDSMMKKIYIHSEPYEVVDFPYELLMKMLTKN